MGYTAPPGVMPPQQPYAGQIFQPTPAFTPVSTQSMYGSSFEDEPPLLEGKRETKLKGVTFIYIVLYSIQIVSK